ncbi:MAG: hypothetical protein IBX45_10810, partial [Campylobacterales bacterium]|nr:hypothetical protein [Campylobacterales bacterium]
IRFTPSSWLIHDPFDSNATTGDFTVEFYGAGAWAGEGSVRDDTDKVGAHSHGTDGNTTLKRNNQRINW